MMNTNYKMRVSIYLSLVIVCSLLPCVAANSTVFTQATALITQVMSFFQGVAHAGLVIGVGWGAFLRYTAGGDHVAVQRADGIMRGSIIAWAVFTGINLITNTLQPYLL